MEVVLEVIAPPHPTTQTQFLGNGIIYCCTKNHLLWSCKHAPRRLCIYFNLFDSFEEDGGGVPVYISCGVTGQSSASRCPAPGTSAAACPSAAPGCASACSRPRTARTWVPGPAWRRAREYHWCRVPVCINNNIQANTHLMWYALA